jgi:hypothetical protein
MVFADFNELVDPLVLPVNGVKYSIPPVSMAAGLKFTRVTAEGSDPTETMSDEEFYGAFLGGTYELMVADGVPAAAVNRAALAALADFQRGREVAEIVWTTGADPKALTAYVAKSQNRAQRRSKSTVAASTTKQPASTSGTRKSPPK